ncbi:response regulator transcription factor [Neobacillus cucumis]|uniref:response regulator transcription factor n=1 Tax=Neobacillus cucumis TaxID=1740721 RepID=UPI001966B9E9|nr:response regulator transcription factor [Neobacillus cucumis]MBM7650913.1 DNA-binding NarL/FixJ family response regulator [Neobacillus cucumis]
MTEIMIVDDQEMVREGLKMILSLHEEIEIVGEASNGEELLALLENKLPDIILMDIRMPVMDGIETLKIVKETYPSLKVIILTTFNEDEYIFNGLKYGADGYVLKDSSSKEIIKAIKSACEGSMLLNSQVSSKISKVLHSMEQTSSNQNSIKDQLSNTLTPREIEVVELIMQGKSNKQIGSVLFLTEGTVKNYISRILDKFELKNRTELVLYLQKSRKQ